MSSSAETFTLTSSIPRHTHSRSAADPVKRPQVYHSASYSLDNSSLTPGTERDTLSSTSSPPKTKKTTTFPLQKHKRVESGAVTSPTVPLFYAQNHHRATADALNLPPAPLPSPPTSKLSSKAIVETRPPVLKRAPASHSSYGIATTCGPPPSFSTQRTLSQDRLWKPAAPDKLDTNTDASTVQVAKGASVMGDPNSVPASSPTSVDRELETVHKDDAGTDALHATDEITSAESPVTDEQSKTSSSEDRKSEDLFLNIAKNSEQQQLPHNDMRKTRASLPVLSNSGLTGRSREERPRSSRQPPNEAHFLSPRTEILQHQNKQLSLGLQTSAGSAHPLDEPRRQRFFSSAAKATSGVARSTVGRDEIIEQPKYIAREATESTISTTAPSTVWDELDDLKSRIKKLELTGKLPSSSAAAMSSATCERPRTATTNATTMSSSPKHAKASVSPGESAIDGVAPTVHPLLHAALNKARPVVSQDIYQKLSATASDALQLAAMMNGSGQPSNVSSIGTVSTSERQIRRRTDSMCRGLTELAIALSVDVRPPPQPARPPSRDPTMTYHSPLTSTFASRRPSNDPDDQTLITARVQSRLATKRTSTFNDSSRSTYSPPEIAAHITPTALPQNQSAPSSHVNRTPSLFRNRRAYGLGNGTADEIGSSPINRPPSRAMTELGRGAMRRYSPRDQANFSKEEYNGPRPMSTAFEDPDDAQESSSNTTFASGLVSRRISGSPASRLGNSTPIPATPREAFGRKFGIGTRRESSVPVSSNEHTPENVTVQRGSGSRRTSGLASRIGSTVGSRLRAVRAEKHINVKEREGRQQSSQRQTRELQQESEKLQTQQTGQEDSSVYGE